MLNSSTNYAVVPPRSREEFIDDNYRKVRESCERIANVLGLNTAASLGPMPKTTYPQSAASGQNQMRTPTEFLSPARKGDETTGTNFFNPSFG